MISFWFDETFGYYSHLYQIHISAKNKHAIKVSGYIHIPTKFTLSWFDEIWKNTRQ